MGMYDYNYGVPELQKPNLFMDWYKMFVEDKKKTKEALLPSPSLDTSSPAPVTSILPPATAPSGAAVPPVVVPTPTTAAPAPMSSSTTPAPPMTPGVSEPSWTDKLNKGLQDPAKMGLLATGLSMMATPPRQVPYSAGEIVGRAGLAGISAYEMALKSSREAESLKMRAEEHKSTAAYRTEQMKHLGFLNQEIQEKIKSGQDMNQIYADSIAGGLDKTIESQYNLPAGTGKLVIRSSMKSGKGIHDMFKQGSVDPKDQEIPADIVPLLGFPEGSKIKWSQAHAVSTLMPKTGKEFKQEPYTDWYEQFKKEKGRPPNTQEISAWHRSTSGEGGGGQAKVGILGSIDREMTNRWYPKLQAAMPPGEESMQKIKEIMVQIGSGDPISGSVNTARMRAEFQKYGLDPKEFMWVKSRAQDLAGGGINPDAAINQAEAEWAAKNPAKGEPKIPSNLKPVIDPATGKQRTSGGRPVYQDPKQPGKYLIY